jgi:predicted metalloprotease
MKWEGNRQSDNVEDRRGEGPMAGGGGFRLGGGRGIGLGTIVIALLAGWIFGINPLALLGVLEGGGVPGATVVATNESTSGTYCNSWRAIPCEKCSKRV